ERIGLDRPLSLLAEFSMDDAALRRFAAGGVINTDDNLFVEFSSPLSLRSVNWLSNIKLLNSFRVEPRRLVTGLAPSFDSEAAFAATLRRYERAKIATLNAAVLTFQGTPDAERQASERMKAVLDSLPDYGLAKRYGGLAEVDIARTQAAAGHWTEAADACWVALASCPDDAEAHRILGRALATSGQLDEAIAHYQESVRLRPRHA